MNFALPEDTACPSETPGRMEAIFHHHAGRRVNKWLHYLPFYDRVLTPYRGSEVRLLEIGVRFGGSLELWRKYFGSAATIFGIDINEQCAGRATPPTQVRIGSQADSAFLLDVVEEMGGLDVVIDDGSHNAVDQKATFSALWSRVAPGGLYVIEDLHTAYWPEWGGGLGRPDTAIELVKALIDDQQAAYHGRAAEHAHHDEIGAITIEDSIVAIEKRKEPLLRGHVWRGVRSTIAGS